MKYIKKYESISSSIKKDIIKQKDRTLRNNEIIKLCGEYLIYLKDSGFRYISIYIDDFKFIKKPWYKKIFK